MFNLIIFAKFFLPCKITNSWVLGIRMWTIFRDISCPTIKKKKKNCFTNIVKYSNILAWQIPWTEEPGRLQSMGSQRGGHDWLAESTHRHTDTHTHNKKVSSWSRNSRVMCTDLVIALSTSLSVCKLLELLRRISTRGNDYQDGLNFRCLSIQTFEI